MVGNQRRKKRNRLFQIDRELVRRMNADPGERLCFAVQERPRPTYWRIEESAGTPAGQQQAFERIANIARRQFAPIVKTHVLTKVEAISLAALFSSEFGGQPGNDPGAADISRQRFEDTWYHLAIFDRGCQRWIKPMKGASNRHAEAPAAGAHGIGNCCGCSQLSNFGVVYVRCAAPQLDATHLRVR